MDTHFLAVALTLAVSIALGEGAFRPKGTVINIRKKDIPNVMVEEYSNGVRVFTLHEACAIEVVDGDNVIAEFDLNTQAPRSLSVYPTNDGTYVVVVIEPALNKVFKSSGSEWVYMSFAKFKKDVLMKDMDVVTLDLDEYDVESTYFPYGRGKRYVCGSPSKRIGKVVFGDDIILSGDYELITDLEVFVYDETKVAKIVYIYKPDDRIKEIFYKRTGDDWVRVDTPVAAKLINRVDPFFSTDYKTQYDGFSLSGVFIVATFVALVVSY